MMESMARFLKRSSRPITMIATAFGGGYLALSYLQSKLNGMHDSLTRTRVCTENLRRRFEQNHEDCSFSVLALIPTLGKQVIEYMNVETLVQVLNQTKSRPKPITQDSEKKNNYNADSELANGHSQILRPERDQSTALENSMTSETSALDGLSSEKSHPETPKSSQPNSSTLKDSTTTLFRPDGTVIRKRSEIWTEMMLVTFSRLFTCLYGLTLLTLQTHIQLGLLGRDQYLSSILSTESLDDGEGLGERLLILPEKSAHDTTTECRYLTFSWWYLHRGWKILSKRIRNAVEQVLESRSLKDAVSLSDLVDIFNSIRNMVELESDGITQYNFVSILLPMTTTEEVETLKLGLGLSPAECEVDDRLRKLLDETHDFIDCPDFRLVLSRAMDQIILLSSSNIASNPLFKSQPPSTVSSFSNNLDTLPRFTQLVDIVQEPSKNTLLIPSPRLVEILPVISKESLNILNVLPNVYVETLSETTELKEFSSVIYTTFDDTLITSSTNTT